MATCGQPVNKCTRTVKAEKDALKREIAQLIQRVPAGWNDWGIVRTREWLDAIHLANRIARRKRQSLVALTNLRDAVAEFHGERTNVIQLKGYPMPRIEFHTRR